MPDTQWFMLSSVFKINIMVAKSFLVISLLLVWEARTLGQDNLFESFKKIYPKYHYGTQWGEPFSDAVELWDSGQTRVPAFVDTLICRNKWTSRWSSPTRYNCFDKKGKKVMEYGLDPNWRQYHSIDTVGNYDCNQCRLSEIQGSAIKDSSCYHYIIDDNNEKVLTEATCEFKAVVRDIGNLKIINYPDTVRTFRFGLAKEHQNWRGLNQYDTLRGLKIQISKTLAYLDSASIAKQLERLTKTLNQVKEIKHLYFTTNFDREGFSNSFRVLSELKHKFLLDWYILSNDHTQNIWKSLSALPNMTELNFYSSGILPTVGSTKSNLRFIRFAGFIYGLQDSALSGFRALSHIQMLHLKSESFPSELLQLSHLKALYVNCPKVTEIDFRGSKLDSLEILFLDGVESLERIIIREGDLPNLRVMLVNEGSQLVEIEGLRFLKKLYTLGVNSEHGANLTKRFPKVVKEARRLHSLKYFGIRGDYQHAEDPYKGFKYTYLPDYDTESRQVAEEDSGIGEWVGLFNIVKLK